MVSTLDFESSIHTSSLGGTCCSCGDIFGRASLLPLVRPGLFTYPSRVRNTVWVPSLFSHFWRVPYMYHLCALVQSSLSLSLFQFKVKQILLRIWFFSFFSWHLLLHGFPKSVRSSSYLRAQRLDGPVVRGPSHKSYLLWSPLKR